MRLRNSVKGSSDLIAGGSGGYEEPTDRYPMDDFDSLLTAFDGFIRGRTDGVSTDHGQPRTGFEHFDSDSRTHQLPAKTDGGARLPRLYSRSSSVLAADLGSQRRPGTRKKDRRTSRTKASPASPSAVNILTPHPALEKRILYGLHDDPMDLMLRSKGQRRSGLGDLQIRPESAGLNNNAAPFDGGSSAAIAGVFRLTHAATGYVHYGYSWDIGGAKAEQLRRLGFESGDSLSSNSTDLHPHRGLSAIVCGYKENNLGGRGDVEGTTPKKLRGSAEAAMGPIWFEVVRRMSLPTRFRAVDFDNFLREACQQELLDRRAHVLVLVARQYKIKHMGPAFRRMLDTCRREGEDETFAAAAEIQRTWRGFHSRDSARRAREKRSCDRVETNQERVGTILATWAQAKHRGNLGRRRACSLREKKIAGAVARKRQASTNAVAIQRWIRSIFRRQKEAVAAADKAVLDALLEAIRLEEERRDSPSTGETPQRNLRGPPRPISASEARVGKGSCDADTEVSLSGASERNSGVPPDTAVQERTPGRSNSQQQQKYRRPPSSRRGSDVPLHDNGKPRREPSSRGQREGKRPSSAPRLTQKTGDAKSVERARPATPELPDASRLVLEEDPKFTSATAIQAAWRGFFARLSIRKRRRAAAALKRKREGKWRKQRGVVGKRVAVAWDERKDLEEGGEGGGTGGKASCTEIQMVARAWLGRRQGRQRKVLAKLGACALCCLRLAEMYLETTEQELCLECYRITGTVLESRKVPPAHSEGAFELLEHRKRQKAATLTQRAWLRFQQRVGVQRASFSRAHSSQDDGRHVGRDMPCSDPCYEAGSYPVAVALARFGNCEVCPRWKGPGAPLPRAARVVCVAGCDRRRHLRYCRRCCAIAHSLRATVGHEIRSVDRYGTEMAAVATLGGAMWRYILKLRFWNLFACHRKHLHSSATLVQSRWRCYRCRRVFTALRRGFLYVEAAARSVERYWFIRSSREDIIANIAGLMAYNVQAFPPGIHPPPAGRFALWERLIVDAIRTRAVTKIQLEWRKKMERAVARAFAHVARLQMIERQRLRALAELHASVDIQRAWRGSQGRRAAFLRAVTIRFARQTAERYANPARFAVANLREFNAHGGFLGIAGVDAWSLLSAAVGVGDEGQGAMTAGGAGVTSREKRTAEGLGDGGKEGIWLRLSPYGENDWGLSADTRVAGIAEVCIRVSLSRCIPLSSGGGMLPPLGAVGGGAESEVARFENDDKVSSGRIQNENSRDAPPLTLKLELISVQIDSIYPNQISPSEDIPVRASAAEYGTDDDDSSLATSDSGGGEDSASRSGSCSRESSINSHGVGTGTSGSTKTTSDHSGESDDEDSEWSGGTGRTTTGSHASRVGNTIKDSTKERRTDGRRSRGGFLENDDDLAVREQGQYQCDVEWCGVNMGGTRAQLAGLPTPRWQGQVFYLPLCAAATPHGRASESTADADTSVDESRAKEHVSHGRTGEGGGQQQQSNPSPSLLKITLNRISCGSDGPASCKGGKQDRRVDIGMTAAQHRTRWSAYLCGLIQPSPVGRAILEAGDILSMLGSQQVVGMTPTSRRGAAGSSRRKEREDGRESAVGWSLRLLLSLENTENTRTRLLVTEVLGAIIQDILDAIPGQVPRIEIRVVGTRPVPTPNAANITSCGLSSRQHHQQPGVTDFGAPRHHEPPLHLCAEWNGNHAAFVKLSSCEDGLMMIDEFLYPGSQKNIGESFDDDDFGTSNECSAQARAAAKSNMIVLPVYVPWIMKDASNDNHLEVLSRTRRPRRSTGGGNVDGDGNYEDDEGGGRSHCLRVTVGTEVQPGRERRKLDVLGHGSHHNGVMGPTTSSSSTGCTSASFQEQTEVCFFERDLLRDDWTEILVPVFPKCPEENARGLVRRPTKQKRWLRHPQANKVVVLRVRSAGFQPKPPPIWLVRRNFAERAVKRIISAAAAAVVQPRVELTLVGLCGAVESLLSERVDTQREGGVEHATPWAESLRPANHRRNSGDSSCGEVLCEAFWNGALVHTLRLRRAVRPSTSLIAESKAARFPAFHPEDTLPIGADDQGDFKRSSSRSVVVITASKSRSSDPNQDEIVDPNGAGLDQPAGGSKPRGADPLTWFPDGGDEMLGNDWVSLGGGVLSSPSLSSAQEEASSHKQQETFRTSHENDVGEHEGHRGDNPSSSERLGQGGEGGSTHDLRSLEWIPMEGDAYTGRPFRFCLPACLMENASGSETGDHCPNVGDKPDREAGNEGWLKPDHDNAHGASLNETEHGDGGAKLRGDLRLVEVEVIDGHGLPKAPGQLSINPQVGPQAAASVVQKGVLNGGVGEGDVLLGEARAPFSLLKEVPFHYLPLRLQPPHPPQPPRCGRWSGVENASTARMAGGGGDCVADFGNTRSCRSSGGGYWSETSVLRGDIVPDSGLLGIGVRIIFPSPTLPDVSCASSASGESSSDLPPLAGAVSDAGREVGDEIVLSVYEAEALVEETRRGEGKKAPSTYCVVLVRGLEVGRTTTIPNSAEPMWATDFRLPDSLLCETNPSIGTPKTADRGGGGRLRPPQPPSGRADRVAGVLILEVWDRVPEGDPVRLGAVEVPPDLLQEVMSSPAPADKDESGVSREDRGTAGEIKGCSPRLHSIHLNLKSPVKNTKQGQLPETRHDEICMVDTVAGTLPAAAEAYGGTGGVLSLSLRRVFATVRPSTSNIPNGPGAIAETSGLLAKENGNYPEAKVPGTRISETALQRYRSKKLKGLADSTQAAREKLDEARALLADAGSSSRGRSATDCAKENAARFVRAWERETSRAERAQLLEAKRSRSELGQEKPGDVNKQLDEDCKEDDQGTHEEHDRREDVKLNGGEHDEEGEEEKEEEPSALETILPRLPAAQKEVFVKVEGVSGLSAPFAGRGNRVYARIFWGGEEQAPLHQPTPAVTAPAACVQSIPRGGSNSNDSVKKVDVLAGGENLADKVRAAAGTAAASVAHATAAAVHASGGGGVGGTMEGHWEQESFVLPIPDSDGTSRDSDAGKNVDLETVDGLLGSNVQGAGDGGGDTAGGDSTSASLDDGVHLRVEVWQGKHCHGQVDLAGNELLRMCKKAFRPYKLALVSREDDGHYRESSAAAPARLTLTLLALEPGQVVAAQAQLAVALEGAGSRILRQQQDGVYVLGMKMHCEARGKHSVQKHHRLRGRVTSLCSCLPTEECPDAGNGTLDPGGRGDSTAREGARAKATGVAEDLVNVLCARRSPLCFRVQPLVIHLNSFKDDSNTRWTGGSSLFLVAKRQVLATAPEQGSYLDSDGESGVSRTATASRSAAGAQGDLSIVRRHGAGDRSHNENRRVVEEEELGRTALFGIHSGTTIVPGTSFTIPPSALVADVKRLSRNGKGGATSSISDIRGENRSEVRLVLEIVQGGETGGGRGSVAPGGQRLPFLMKRATATRDSISEKGEGGGARVVARATLDAGFLRRTIGCQRSVGMTTVAPSVGETGDAKHSKGEDGQSPTSSPFARLDIAGHVVSARPGRPRLRLQVLECQNLRGADMLGKSDPCVLVFWNGVEVGRTPIARDDLHPVFSAAMSTFQLPLLPPPTSNLQSGDGRSGRSSVQRSANWRAYTPELRLEVWDMDRDTFRRKWKKGQLLGSVDLRGPYGIAPLIEASTAVQAPGVGTTANVDNKIPGVFIRLRAPDGQGSKHGAAGGEAGQVSAGVMSIRTSIEDHTDDSEAWISQAPKASTGSIVTFREASTTKVGAVATNALELERSRPAQSSLSSRGTTLTAEAGRKTSLGIHCLDARGLPAGCDGYCRVFWNGRQVGSTLSASCFAHGTRHTAGLGHAAAASVYQRNPVWWTSSDKILSDDDRGCRKPSLDKCSGANAVVPLNENPTVADELVLEVFDGSVRKEGKKSTAGMLAKCRASLGESVAGKDAADLKADEIGVGLNSATIASRDVFGRSLGIVTIHGEHLTNPPHGRIDLPLLLPPSCKGVNASRITLSISLKQIVDGERLADVAVPRHMRAAEQRKSNDNVPTTMRSSATTNTMLVAKREGGEWEALKEQMTSQRPTRWLRLLLQGAQLRRGLDVSGTSDPFCTVYVDRVWFAETRVCWGTLAPRWDQQIEIEVFGRGGAPAQGLGLVGHEIRVEVWDKDVVGANDFIGEVHLFLRERHDG
ncbi:unnamed protein product [Ectocarpus sp. CCAP 1310/34]|nr:unnamed protein product [Ectocarpus sp. CCAP 1310/34]